jgi:hypothetical protein
MFHTANFPHNCLFAAVHLAPLPAEKVVVTAPAKSTDTQKLLKFNLNTLPVGASVSKATLRLFVDQVAAPGSFDVFQLNSNCCQVYVGSCFLRPSA